VETIVKHQPAAPGAGPGGAAEGAGSVASHRAPAPAKKGRVSRRGVLIGGTAAVAALSIPEMLKELSWLPNREALAAVNFPDIQFELGPFMPAARTFDGILVGMPPIHTIFLTARLARPPSKADAGRMESALTTIEANYPYAPGGVFTHVSYSDNYFARLPAALVNARMPRTIAFGEQLANQPVLKRAVPGPSDVSPGNHVFQLRRPQFNVPVRMESNDVLFTIRSDNVTYADDVAQWLSGSNTLIGRPVNSPRFDAGMTITSKRFMFVQMGLPRNIAYSNNLAFESFINPFSPMWMGFADQQVDASSPSADVTFVGAHGIKLTNANPGDYFDNGAIQHLSHVLLDLQQFYVDGKNPDEGPDTREPFDERIQYMFTIPPEVPPNPNDPFLNGGGPSNLGLIGAVVPNVFRGSDAALRHAQQFARIGHNDGLHRSGRMPDGRPIHQRIDGPGFDTMDTTNGTNTPKLQFSGFFPSADFFANLRRNVAAVDLLQQFNLGEEDHGLERFLSATRRQNYLIPPRRHRAFPLIELT
jgi:hypothetical protein